MLLGFSLREASIMIDVGILLGNLRISIFCRGIFLGGYLFHFSLSMLLVFSLREASVMIVVSVREFTRGSDRLDRDCDGPGLESWPAGSCYGSRSGVFVGRFQSAFRVFAFFGFCFGLRSVDLAPVTGPAEFKFEVVQ